MSDRLWTEATVNTALTYAHSSSDTLRAQFAGEMESALTEQAKKETFSRWVKIGKYMAEGHAMSVLLREALTRDDEIDCAHSPALGTWMQENLRRRESGENFLGLVEWKAMQDL